jgi:hypothetical protein
MPKPRGKIGQVLSAHPDYGVPQISSHTVGEEFGAAEGTRTPDPIITNDVLYQLSYSGLVAGY